MLDEGEPDPSRVSGGRFGQAGLTTFTIPSITRSATSVDITISTECTLLYQRQFDLRVVRADLGRLYAFGATRASTSEPPQGSVTSACSMATASELVNSRCGPKKKTKKTYRDSQSAGERTKAHGTSQSERNVRRKFFGVKLLYTLYTAYLHCFSLYTRSSRHIESIFYVGT